jgi:hypothetical protein
MVASMCRGQRTALKTSNLIEGQAAPESSHDYLATLPVKLSQQLGRPSGVE